MATESLPPEAWPPLPASPHEPPPDEPTSPAFSQSVRQPEARAGEEGARREEKSEEEESAVARAGVEGVAASIELTEELVQAKVPSLKGLCSPPLGEVSPNTRAKIHLANATPSQVLIAELSEKQERSQRERVLEAGEAQAHLKKLKQEATDHLHLRSSCVLSCHN